MDGKELGTDAQVPPKEYHTDAQASERFSEFYSDTIWCAFCSTPLYFTHMLIAVAEGDAEVKRAGDPCSDWFFRWIKPPAERRYRYPAITYSDPGELRRLPHLGLNEQKASPVARPVRSLEETWTNETGLLGDIL